MKTTSDFIDLGGGKVLQMEITKPIHPSEKLMPSVCFFHGGGWYQGSYPIPTAWGEALVRNGYFVVSVDYRLSGEAKWPAQIEDCKLVVRWLRTHAEKYGVDPERIGCWGRSAGGHLAACLGLMEDLELEKYGGYDLVDSKVQAVVDFCGPSDLSDGNFASGSDEIMDSQKAINAEVLLALLGEPFSENSEIWKQASPLTWVRPGAPPFLVVHGEKDQVVSYTQSQKLVASLQRVGVSTEFITVKNGQHQIGMPNALGVIEPETDELISAVVAFFDQYLKTQLP